jgi:hypothetical protein
MKVVQICGLNRGGIAGAAQQTQTQDTERLRPHQLLDAVFLDVVVQMHVAQLFANRVSGTCAAVCDVLRYTTLKQQC